MSYRCYTTEQNIVNITTVTIVTKLYTIANDIFCEIMIRWLVDQRVMRWVVRDQIVIDDGDVTANDICGVAAALDVATITVATHLTGVLFANSISGASHHCNYMNAFY